jgi:hypothetical protein
MLLVLQRDANMQANGLHVPVCYALQWIPARSRFHTAGMRWVPDPQLNQQVPQPAAPIRATHPAVSHDQHKAVMTICSRVSAVAAAGFRV